MKKIIPQIFYDTWHIIYELFFKNLELNCTTILENYLAIDTWNECLRFQFVGNEENIGKSNLICWYPGLELGVISVQTLPCYWHYVHLLYSIFLFAYGQHVNMNPR